MSRMLSLTLNLVLALLSAEAAARAALSYEPLRVRVAGGDDPVSHRLRWEHRHRYGRAVWYTFDRHHPVRGWAPRPLVRGAPDFPGRSVTTNSEGRRGTAEHAPEKRPGVRRVLLLGDSFTFGDEVADDETFAAVLERGDPRIEVVNAGVHGYGHDQMLLLLQEEGRRYRPDVVVLGFVYLDIGRNALDFWTYAKPRFRLRADRLELANVPVPPPDETARAARWGSRALDLVRMAWDRLTAGDRRRHDEARRLTPRLLEAIAAASRSAGARPVFVYLPVLDEANDVRAEPTGPERFLLEACARSRVECASLRPLFAEAVRRGHVFARRPGGHWDADAHRVAAEGLRLVLEGGEAFRSAIPPGFRVAGPGADAAPAAEP